VASTPRSFDTTRIGFGELIAGASALALLLFMTILPWFEIGGKDLSEEEEEEFEEVQDVLDFTFNAWEAFAFIDIILLLIVLATVAYVVARALDALPVLPVPPGLIVAGLGALAVLLILFRIIVTPNLEVEIAGETFKAKDEEDSEVNRKIFGLFFGLVSAAGIAVGGYLASQERGGVGPGRPGAPATAGAPGAVGPGPGPGAGAAPQAGAPAAQAGPAAGAQQAGGQPAADWYPDPKGEARLRYWDGTRWTDQTAD
jgi:hypothetical protein